MFVIFRVVSALENVRTAMSTSREVVIFAQMVKCNLFFSGGNYAQG